MQPVEKLLAKLPDAKKAGKGWSARCPAHEDRRASLSIVEGDDGRALVKCHAGCKADAICRAIGLSMSDLMPMVDALQASGTFHCNGNRADGRPQIVARYGYRDEADELLLQVVRYEPKGFRQRRPKVGGGWEWSVKGVRSIPYRLPEFLAEPMQPVAIVEGEKDVDNLARIGVLATCNAGGAGKWTAQHAEFLRDRHVFILPDNDEPGRRHAHQVAMALQSIAASVRIVELPGLRDKGDVSDWIATGGTKAKLKRLVDAAPDWLPAAVEVWKEIESLDNRDLPPFPTHVLPDVLRRFVEQESHATQTPADLAGLLALAVCSAAIARRVEVEPRPGWREPVNLFVAVFLEAGNRKSAVFTNATRPLRDFESELIEEARLEFARAQSKRRQDELRLKRLEKTAAEKGDAEARQEASELAEAMAAQLEPTLPRLIVDDATNEKLEMILAEQGGRLASMSPEGNVFDVMAGRYSNSGSPNFDVYLKGHSGDDLNIDRVTRQSVRVSRPSLTCAYAMQPAVIVGLAEKAAFRGRGLLARFLYAAPESWIGQRIIAPEPVSGATREAFRQTVRALADLEGEHVLGLTADASAAFEQWEAEIEAMLGDGGQMELMRDWGAKLAGATLRLAAVLHCVEREPAERMDAETIAAAVEVARYLIPHAELVLNMMLANEETADDDARYVLRWIERHGRREFTKTEAQHHGKRRFPKADDIDPALAELARRAYIRSKPSEATGPGRPPSPSYEVNPAVFGEQNRERRSRNSHNSASESAGDHSGNIGSASDQSESANRIRKTI